MKTNLLPQLKLRSQFHCPVVLITLLIVIFVQRIEAFSLLGPYTDWMTPTNGYRLSGDIGGPMNINEGYRWNVPYVTYGFDKSFVDYFGSNGVAAVESAIQILNDLPAASDIVLTNYPWASQRINVRAESLSLYDLKSTALVLLLEQLGLTQPTRNIFALLSSTNATPGFIRYTNTLPPFIVCRNFDPETLAPTFFVNGTLYAFYLFSSPGLNVAIPFPVDPEALTYTAVADGYSYWYDGLQGGGYYLGLTRDDVGGLRCLLNATNINWERLPNDVFFIGPQKKMNESLRGAWRPGVEKINFMPQPQDKRGKFKPAVFKYTALYVTNGVVLQQPVERIVLRPDILFCVANTGRTNPIAPIFLRTGTDRWANNAPENGNPTNAGPGVIVPPIRITFDKLGPIVPTSGFSFSPYAEEFQSWGSFDYTTNVPVIYPPNTGQHEILVQLSFFDTNMPFAAGVSNAEFRVDTPYGGQASLQISTNEMDWLPLTTVVNFGSITRWQYYSTTTLPVSFRVVPAGQ